MTKDPRLDHIPDDRGPSPASAAPLRRGQRPAQNQDTPIFDAWETTEDSVRYRIQFERLCETVLTARSRSPFYSERLKNFDPERPASFEEVPLLSSRELRAGLAHHEVPSGVEANSSETLGLPPLRVRDEHLDSGFSVFQSGGTTGKPKSSFFTHEELEGLNLPNSRGFTAVGLSPNDRVANLWAVGGLYMTFVHINRMLQQFGCMSFPFSNNTASEFVENVVRQFGINTITGITSVALKTLRAFSDGDSAQNPLRIRKIYFGGEHIYEADRLEMQDRFGTEIIAAPGYGSVDSWYIGYQCLHCPPGVFHTHDDQVYLEILNPDSSAPVQRDEVGMMYVTAFPRKLTPIIRYAVGDRAHWIKAPCACGRKTPRFQLLGRGDDILRIGYDSVDYQDIQKVVVRHEGLTGNVRMEKLRHGGKDQLSIRIESKGLLQPEASAALADEVRRGILTDRPTLRDFIAKNQIHELIVAIEAPGQLPRHPRTGKLLRVIDVQ